MTDEEVLEALGSSQPLPTLPDVVAQVIAALDDDKVDGEQAADLLARDPAIMAHVLHMANSSYYNPSGAKVTSLSYAITRLGFQQVREIVMTVGVISTFEVMEGSLDYAGFWRHCLTTGVAAATLAERSGREDLPSARRDNPYFVAGLLHDVGVVLMQRTYGSRYDDLLSGAGEQGQPLCELEADKFGFSHAQAGAALLASWELADEVVEVARFHHQPEQAPAAQRARAEIVHLADWITHHLGYGATHDGYLEGFDDRAWKSLGLDVEEIPAVMDEFEKSFDDSGGMLV